MHELMKSGYICHPQQICTVRRMTLAEGKAKGTDVIEICTAGGLQVDILPDCGLDIGQVRFKGVNMTFISKNGYDSPAVAIPYESEFLNTFPGGLVYTCGLRTTGGGHRDGEEWQPFHGRYHDLPAQQVCVEEADGFVTVKGTIRETALFGHALEVRRTIRIPVDGADITLCDELTNLGFREEEFALLYHCNFGYPLVSPDATLMLPENRKTTPRTDYAATGLAGHTGFYAPIPGDPEMVFFHEDMPHTAALVNPSAHVRMELCWSDTLPVLAHWRSMASGDYVCGLEPTNCYIMGRKFERENGTLPTIAPFETVKTQVAISFRDI